MGFNPFVRALEVRRMNDVMVKQWLTSSDIELAVNSRKLAEKGTVLSQEKSQ